MTSALPLSGFAAFLRHHRAAILADWRGAVSANAPEDPDLSARAAAAAAWLDELEAVGDGRSAPARAALRHRSPGRSAPARTILTDIAVLHRVVARRAHLESGGWGLPETELLWQAFQGCLIDLLDPVQEHQSAGGSAREDEERQALRAREEMLAVVTHDLRTPLSVVVAGASMLTTIDAAQPDVARIRRRAETILRAAEHMTRLVQDLSDLARLDAGRLPIEPTLQDPADVIREVVEALAPVVARRGGTLFSETRADLRRVRLDRDRIRQVIANLVGNASKAGASQVTVDALATDTEVVFRVTDNGPGIPPEDLPRMFDRYWRGSGTQYKGSGLGLAIAKGIVAAHGGRIWIDSAPGKGSTFFFSIPG